MPSPSLEKEPSVVVVGGANESRDFGKADAGVAGDFGRADVVFLGVPAAGVVDICTGPGVGILICLTLRPYLFSKIYVHASAPKLRHKFLVERTKFRTQSHCLFKDSE